MPPEMESLRATATDDASNTMMLPRNSSRKPSHLEKETSTREHQYNALMGWFSGINETTAFGKQKEYRKKHYNACMGSFSGTKEPRKANHLEMKRSTGEHHYNALMGSVQWNQFPPEKNTRKRSEVQENTTIMLWWVKCNGHLMKDYPSLKTPLLFF